jgi:hypothetical protein
MNHSEPDGGTVKDQVFISYPSRDQDIGENMASCLREYGVAAWVCSI